MPDFSRDKLWGGLAAGLVLVFAAAIAAYGTGPREHRVDSREVRVVEAAFFGARRPNASDPMISLHRQRGALADKPRQVHAALDRASLAPGPLAVFLPETGGRAEMFVNSVSVEAEPSVSLLANVPDGLLLGGNNRFDLRVEPHSRPLRRTDTGPIYLGPAGAVTLAARRAETAARALRLAGVAGALLCALGGGLALAMRQSAGVVAGLLVLGVGMLIHVSGWPVAAVAAACGVGFAVLVSDREARLGRACALVGVGACLLALLRDGSPAWTPLWEPLGLGATSATTAGAVAVGAMALLSQGQDLRARARATQERLREQARTITEQDRAIREAVAREAVLEERQRFTRDMHDGVGAQLTSLLIRLRAGRADLPTVEADLQQGLADLRLVVDSLDRVGTSLDEALEAFRSRAEQQVRAAGLDFAWESPGTLGADRLGEQAILHLYRFLQETLSNALRHGEAERLAMTMEEAESRLSVRVEDDGKGFDAATARQGRGMRSLRERAKALDGELSVASAPGEGTTVTLDLPLRPRAD